MELLPLRGSSAQLGGGGEAVEVVAFCADAFGEVPCLPLLFEPVVKDGSACGLAMLETVGGPVEAGLVEGDLPVEPGDRGSDVGLPPLLGGDLPLRPHPSFFSSGVAVPPPGAMIGGPLGLLACLAGLGEVPDGPTRLAGLPETAAGVQVGPGLLGLGQSAFGLA